MKQRTTFVLTLLTALALTSVIGAQTLPTTDLDIAAPATAIAGPETSHGVEPPATATEGVPKGDLEAGLDFTADLVFSGADGPETNVMTPYPDPLNCGQYNAQPGCSPYQWAGPSNECCCVSTPIWENAYCPSICI